MKKLLFLLCFGLLFFGSTENARGSHFAGGEIWYEYVGTPQFPHRYDVFVIIYRDVSGAAMTSYIPAQLCINSSCFSPQTLSLPLLPFNLQPGSDTLPGSYPGSIITPELKDCVDPNAQNLVVTEAYRFYKQVDLPGKCSDFTFAFVDNARNTSSNMTTAGNFYIEAKLNNVLGNNSSPEFLNPAAKSFCVGTPFIWSQAAVEPDGDSLIYDFGTPYEGVCGAPVQMNFRPGYSQSQPMTTLNGINFNNRTGTLRFTAAKQEVVVINITVTEKRYVSSLGQWLVIGTSVRDLQVPVVTGCRVAAQNGPQFATGSYPSQSINADSIKGYGFSKISNPDSVEDPVGSGNYKLKIPVIDYNCFDKVVNIKFKDGVYCETISADGSEFRLIGPDSAARPVTAVVDNCRPDLVTKDIDLLLHQALDINGDYFLQIKKGTDGNTLTNKCGFPLDPFFMVIIRVDNCPVLDYQLNNVSVTADHEIDIDWEIDNSSFAPPLFTAWNILRANENDQYYKLTSLDKPGDVNLRSFKDTTLDHSAVDMTQWQYMVQLVQNGKAMPPTNLIHSILLRDSLNPDRNGTIYSWSVYDGWDSALYEFQYTEFDTVNNQVGQWATFDGPDQEYFMDEYLYPSCEANRDTGGLYVFRVIATDPNNPNGFKSESNWLYYKLDCEKPEPRPNDTTIIPTVFTPNGDNQNDLFKISTSFQFVDIAVYNRWGKPVFSQTGDVNQLAWNGTDQNSGQKVSDGVYYYVLKLKGEFPNGSGGIENRTMEKSGSLTIFTNGTK